MPDIYMDVDTAVVVPMNIAPVMKVDGLTIEDSLVYNMAGIAVRWNFVTTAGVMTTVAITPTTGGAYDIAEPLADIGMYTIEIPASGGASANNDTEGFGWITGRTTADLPFRGPVIGFRRAALNDLLIDGSTASTNLEDFFDGTGYAGGTTKLAVSVNDIIAAAAKALADVIYLRDMSKVETGADNGVAGRTGLDALRFIRNKWTASGDTLSVKKEDDSTEAWAATITHDPVAEPITGMDPS